MKKSLKASLSMARLITQQTEGGQTIAEFCRTHRIKPGKFFYWKKKMRQSGKIPTGRSQSESHSADTFIPIKLPALPAPTIELHFPSGLRACIPVSTETALLMTIIKACGR